MQKMQIGINCWDNANEHSMHNNDGLVEYFDHSCNWMSFAKSVNANTSDHDVDKSFEYSITLN